MLGFFIGARKKQALFTITIKKILYLREINSSLTSQQNHETFQSK